MDRGAPPEPHPSDEATSTDAVEARPPLMVGEPILADGAEGFNGDFIGSLNPRTKLGLWTSWDPCSAGN